MGWSVGRDYERRRHIGYGVPATCDYPGCGAEIDRGFSYACGGGLGGWEGACGLFFCYNHLSDYNNEDNTPMFEDQAVCAQCYKSGDQGDYGDWEPFEPTPDSLVWAQHVLTDESWAEWRDEEPEWVEDMRRIVRAHE